MLFDPKNFDPSKLDPKVVIELTALMRQLPHEQIMKMQSLMHNSMAGFDISKDVAAFESSLPPDFRQKLYQLMNDGMRTGAVPTHSHSNDKNTEPVELPQSMTMKEARLTLLKGVAAGTLSPEEALKALFYD